MEKLLNPYDKESMKIAMLKHEETFRCQVYELHRLYQIQKGLMKKIAEQKRQESVQNSNDSKGTNADESGIEDDESDLELTLGPSCYNRRRKGMDSAPSFSSSSSDSSHVKKNNSNDFLGELQKGIEVSEQFRQGRLKNPPWVLQFLSLNMT